MNSIRLKKKKPSKTPISGPDKAVAKDPLYAIFEHHLFNSLLKEESPEKLIDQVVDDFLNQLRSMGQIPANVMQSFMVDLKEEVTEMYRKKTYGHGTIYSFQEEVNLQRRNQKGKS